MSTIVLYTSGTLGDHLPFIALGKTLQERGHRVRMAVNRAMLDYARRSGLEAFELTDRERGPEEARANASSWNHWKDGGVPPPPLRERIDVDNQIVQARELIDICGDADLLVATSIRPLGFVAASALGLPWLTASLNPNIFWDPPGLGERERLRRGRLREYRSLLEIIAPIFEALDISEPLPSWSRSWLFARNVLLASSPRFSLPDLGQFQPYASIDMTGFWFYQDPAWEGWRPDEDLRAFCDRGPIVLSFSSQPLEDRRRLLALHAEAASKLEMPLLVQRGWADFREEDLPGDRAKKDVMFADFLPHDWLFARAACSVQHGGIGSLARALRQGCPLLLEPFGNDQLYNANQAGELGVAAVVHPFETTAGEIAEALETEVLTPRCRRRAGKIGEHIAREKGTERASVLIERCLDRRSGDEGGSWLFPVPLSLPSPPLSPAPPPAEAPIPKVIHQSWKNDEVPEDLAALRQTWKKHHPGWEFYFWTDEDNREFMERHYPWFLPIFTNYPEAIMRADAVRYFILHHYGGLYVDLDYESFRPLDPLLEGKELLLVPEPQAHLETHFPLERTFPLLISNAIMASAARHPFWEHLFRELVASHLMPGALDATGPFMISRAYWSCEERGALTVAHPALLNPFSNEVPWIDLPGKVRERIAATAYAVHYWRGSWWRKVPDLHVRFPPLRLLEKGEERETDAVDLEACLLKLRKETAPPLVSCLMITGDRPTLAWRSVLCFLAQNYPAKELVIVDDGGDDTLEGKVTRLADERILYRRLPADGKTLGELRNTAVAEASGIFVAQWDDDDLSDPHRLEVQLALLRALEADLCLLERQVIWWPADRRMGISRRRFWEGSFLALKSKLPPYPAQRHGEDAPVVRGLVAAGRTAIVDLPYLYTYVFHGGNTFAAEHWAEQWTAATERYEDSRYETALQDLEERLGMKFPPPGEGEEPQIDAPSSEAGRGETTPGLNRASLPRVLILVPVKDAVPHLPRFLENLESLTYPRELLSIAFLESDSSDGTFAFLGERLPGLRRRLARAEVFKKDYNFRLEGPRWDPARQFMRRSVMAKSRNHLLSRALGEEEWVLWIDVDVARWPPDVIERLLAPGVDIVVPNCLSEGTGETFDFNTFKLAPDAERLDWSPYLLHGILQPPKGFGRLYLSDLRGHEIVEVNGVGGTMLLLRADLHREGLVFPPFSYRFHIETEGLAYMARDMGYRCWGLPELEIFHP